MFDDETAALIRSAPELSELNVKELPDKLTRIFSELVSLRVSLREDDHDNESIVKIIDFTRRLAQSNEALAIVNPKKTNRSAAAFVSATAYKLQFQAESLLRKSQPRAYVNATNISSDISAMLLYIIAGSFADASDIGNMIRLPNRKKVLERELVKCLISLIQGNISEILENASQIDKNISFGEHIDDELQAVNTLYFSLLSGVRVLASNLLSENTESSVDPFEAFSEVKELAYQRIDTHFENFIQENEIHDFQEISHIMPIIYSGPYHLACLLLIAGDSLLDGATINTPSPNDTFSRNNWRIELKNIAKIKPYLWNNHLDAIKSNYLSNGVSSVINLPTGAGKSIIAQLKILSVILTQKKVVFIAPTHALVDQTVYDLKKVFPNVSIQGDISINSDFAFDNILENSASILVMTPEACLQHNCLDPEFYDDFGLMVFDECHIFHPESYGDRRALDSMLCILNFVRSAPQADIMLISAMIKNVNEICKWVEYLTGNEAITISGTWKPTRQLRGCVVYKGSDVDKIKNILDKIILTKEKAGLSVDEKRKIVASPSAFFSVKQTWISKKQNDYSCVKLLEEDVQLGVSKYRKLTPNSSEVAAKIASKASKSGFKTLIVSQQIRTAVSTARKISKNLKLFKIKLTKSELDLLDISKEELGGIEELFLDIKGKKLDSQASVHHGLLLPAERKLVESLFKRNKEFGVLVCTSTLIEGMNLPADLVILANDLRYNPKSEKREMLKPENLLNAAGRAGRAGNNSTGIVLVIPGNIVVFDEESNTISGHWMELQDIFRQSDQCLVLDDPLTELMDRIHSKSENNEDLEKYVLSRLVGNNISDEEDSIDKTFSKSFAVFRMREKGDRKWIESRLESAKKLLFDGEIYNDEEVSNTLFLAATLGIPEDILQKMLEDIIDIKYEECTNVFKLIDWMFNWIQTYPSTFCRILRKEDMDSLLGSEFNKLTDDVEISEFAIPKLKLGLKKWMKGKPLNNIQKIFSTKPNFATNCMSSRKFVIRIIPNLAHLMNAISRIVEYEVRKNSMDEIFLTPALHYLYKCVRYGYSSAEMAAITSDRDFFTLSRRKIHEKFANVEEYLENGEEKENIEEFNNRIKKAVYQFKKNI